MQFKFAIELLPLKHPMLWTPAGLPVIRKSVNHDESGVLRESYFVLDATDTTELRIAILSWGNLARMSASLEI